jgi:hypothetical protein
MMAKRKFFKTVVKVTVLSEDIPAVWRDLADLHYLITDGSCSGRIDTGNPQSISARRAADELFKQGSDPSFFQLSGSGEDLRNRT